MIFIIGFVCCLIGFALGYKIGYDGGHMDGALENPTPCPHGYEDWDDCPDCRH